MNVEKAGEVCETYANIPVIITADLNSKSPWWWSVTRNAKGELAEEFISAHGLFVENRQNNPPTFESRAGATSNIDVTLTNRLAHRPLSDWRVTQGLTTRNHNMIVFNYGVLRNQLGDGGGGNAPNVTHGTSLNFNYKKADWTKMRQMFMTPSEVTVGDDVDRKAKELTSALRATVRHSVPK